MRAYNDLGRCASIPLRTGSDIDTPRHCARAAIGSFPEAWSTSSQFDCSMLNRLVPALGNKKSIRCPTITCTNYIGYQGRTRVSHVRAVESLCGSSMKVDERCWHQCNAALCGRTHARSGLAGAYGKCRNRCCLS